MQGARRKLSKEQIYYIKILKRKVGQACFRGDLTGLSSLCSFSTFLLSYLSRDFCGEVAQDPDPRRREAAIASKEAL